jgi:non-heme chloroperoxidase
MDHALPSNPAIPDEDLAEQALPGHGIPSQDPDPKAQIPIAPEEAEREARSVMAGGGMVGGVAVGAGIGAAMGGPLGVVLGGTVGAVAGALGAAAAGTAMQRGAANSAD